MVRNPSLDPESIVCQNPDYQPVSDIDLIESLVDQVIEENSQTLADYRAGHEKAFAFLVGQVMKKTRGKASPHQFVVDAIPCFVVVERGRVIDRIVGKTSVERLKQKLRRQSPAANVNGGRILRGATKSL